MYEVPAIYDQDVLISQWREFPPDFKMKGGRLRFVNTQLHNWDISTWIYMPEHGPCPVIESP
ncbi:MAG: hypothetical protein WAM39_08895 [Bryobacteraceae bacterium]